MHRAVDLRGREAPEQSPDLGATMSFLGSLRSYVRYALRGLRASPGFMQEVHTHFQQVLRFPVE
jgi:hypothetical protein